MSRVDQDNDSPIGRNSQPRQQREEERRDQQGIGHTPNKAEGDERDMDEALRRKTEH